MAKHLLYRTVQILEQKTKGLGPGQSEGRIHLLKIHLLRQEREDIGHPGQLWLALEFRRLGTKLASFLGMDGKDEGAQH